MMRKRGKRNGHLTASMKSEMMALECDKEILTSLDVLKLSVKFGVTDQTIREYAKQSCTKRLDNNDVSTATVTVKKQGNKTKKSQN